MKNNLSKIMAFVAVFAATVLPGCRKDTETFVEYLPTLGDIQNQILKQVPTSDGITVFTFLPQSTDTIFIANSGIRLVFNDLQHLFADSTGKTVTPADCPGLKITLIEAVKRSEQIAHFLSATSAGKILEPAGFVKIEISCGNRSLQVLPARNFKINLPVASQDDQKQGLDLFGGAVVGKNVADWVALNQEIYLSNWQTANGQVFGYELLAPKTGWLGAAKLNADLSTNFCINLHKEHNSQNTVVWMWLPGTNSLVKMEGTGEAGQFCFPKSPVGHPVKIVVVSKLGDVWEFVKKETEVGNDANILLLPGVFSVTEIIENLRGF